MAGRRARGHTLALARSSDEGHPMVASGRVLACQGWRWRARDGARGEELEGTRREEAVLYSKGGERRMACRGGVEAPLTIDGAKSLASSVGAIEQTGVMRCERAGAGDGKPEMQAETRTADVACRRCSGHEVNGDRLGGVVGRQLCSTLQRRGGVDGADVSGGRARMVRCGRAQRSTLDSGDEHGGLQHSRWGGREVHS